MFPLLFLCHGFPFEGFDAHMAGGNLKYDESNELHRHVKIERDILGSLILDLFKEDENAEHFPPIDMSIWS
jgi:hypothetical protein